MVINMVYSGTSQYNGQSTYRFDSVRDGPNEVKWLVDGKDYMSEVADAINNATYEVLITDHDWEFHYNLSLKRSNSKNATEEWRLEWKVFIYIFCSTANHQRVISHSGMKPLMYLRMQTNTMSFIRPWNSVRWSYHEKLVVIDRSLAFVGGIDLALGRWDTSDHRLTDNNDSPNSSRLPWHAYDVSCIFNGEPALDVARHFIQRFNALRHWQKLSEHQPTITHRIQNPSTRNSKIQVVLSVASWSANQHQENSILKAKKTNFLFLVHRMTERLKIQSKIVDRIVRADENNEDFHVLPLKPDITGEFCERYHFRPNLLELRNVISH